MQRIREEHPDDALAIVNDRVKGSLRVTRAFGAGFLKQVLHFTNIQAHLSFSCCSLRLRICSIAYVCVFIIMLRD